MRARVAGAGVKTYGPPERLRSRGGKRTAYWWYALRWWRLRGAVAGGDGERILEPPGFDLTGICRTTGVSCTRFSTDLSRFALERFDAEVEEETLAGAGVRIIQMGNELEITGLDTGSRSVGTISGDQIRYSESLERVFGGVDVDVYGETVGDGAGAGFSLSAPRSSTGRLAPPWAVSVAAPFAAAA